jgi:pSer/pThr/pTyr-binding forkhead associated (FHA) protein
MNDIVIPRGDSTIEQRHFVIHYDDNIKAYSIMDLKSSTGTFVKLEEPYRLRNKSIISFGNSHMVVSLNPDGIKLSFIDGPKNDESFEFNKNDRVQIGRLEDCQIRFDENNVLSRY